MIKVVVKVKSIVTPLLGRCGIDQSEKGREGRRGMFDCSEPFITGARQSVGASAILTLCPNFHSLSDTIQDTVYNMGASSENFKFVKNKINVIIMM